MTYDQWFRSQQGVAYEGAYLFAEAAWDHQQKALEEAGRIIAVLEPLANEVHAARSFLRDQEHLLAEIAKLQAENERLAREIEHINSQEPVAWMVTFKSPDTPDGWLTNHYHGCNAIADYRSIDPDAKLTPLYAAPPYFAKLT